MPQTLGSTLRGARLGYRYVDRLDAYLRITISPGTFTAHLAPSGEVPKKLSNDLHLLWWEGDAETIEELLSLIAAAVAGDLPSARLKRPLDVVFNDDGSVSVC